MALAQLSVKYQLALIWALFMQLFVIVATKNHAEVKCWGLTRSATLHVNRQMITVYNWTVTGHMINCKTWVNLAQTNTTCWHKSDTIDIRKQALFSKKTLTSRLPTSQNRMPRSTTLPKNMVSCFDWALHQKIKMNWRSSADLFFFSTFPH